MLVFYIGKFIIPEAKWSNFEQVDYMGEIFIKRAKFVPVALG